ncbi:unnamed protein product [Arctogadus glacialis]
METRANACALLPLLPLATRDGGGACAEPNLDSRGRRRQRGSPAHQVRPGRTRSQSGVAREQDGRGDGPEGVRTQDQTKKKKKKAVGSVSAEGLSRDPQTNALFFNCLF